MDHTSSRVKIIGSYDANHILKPGALGYVEIRKIKTSVDPASPPHANLMRVDLFPADEKEAKKRVSDYWKNLGLQPTRHPAIFCVE